jgi:hypothetical protein
MATHAIQTDRSTQIGIHQARGADTTSAGGDIDGLGVQIDRNQDRDSRGEFDLDGDLDGIRCLHTQKGGCLRLSSEFAF